MSFAENIKGLARHEQQLATRDRRFHPAPLCFYAKHEAATVSGLPVIGSER